MQTVRVLIYNVSGRDQPLRYTLTRGDEQLASASLDVGETPGGDHYTLEAQFGQLERGDNLRMTVSLPEESEEQLTNLDVSCSGGCLNRFTVRITEQDGLELYGRSSSEN